MAKFKPGIPDNFTLDVEPVRDLGDYLDEPSPAPIRRPKPQAPEQREARGEPVPPKADPIVTRAEPPPVVPQAAPAVPPAAAIATAIASPAPVTAPPTVQPTQTIELEEERVLPQPPSFSPPIAKPAPAPAVENEDRAPKPKAPRREISMTPETLKMSDELLEVIRSGSGQRDTKANELFHALVLLVHEAMDELDPHTIPKRGRWGTPTARAYPLELKNAFLQALLRKYAEVSESPTGLKYPVNNAA